MRKGKSDLTRVRKKLAERKVNGECRIARRRDEFFRIKQFRRIYDRAEGKFTFNISYETHTKPTPRSLVVAEAFGLGIDEAQKFKVLDASLTKEEFDDKVKKWHRLENRKLSSVS